MSLPNDDRMRATGVIPHCSAPIHPGDTGTMSQVTPVGQTFLTGDNEQRSSVRPGSDPVEVPHDPTEDTGNRHDTGPMP